MRKLLASFLVVFILLSCIDVSSVLAKEEAKPADSYSFQCGEPIITDELHDRIDEFKKEEANMAEKFMTSQVQNLLRIGDLNGLATLIFGNPYCVWGGTSDNGYNATMSADGIFTVDEREKILKPIMKLFGSIFFLLLILSMLLSGLKLGLNSVRGSALADFGEDSKMLFLVVLLALGYGLFTDTIFQLNAAFVQAIREVITNQGVSLTDISLLHNFSSIIDVIGIGPFIILTLAEWILALILNFVYLARKVVIMLLLILGFLAMYSLLFAKTRAFFGTWLREFIGNVFLQSIHALVMYGALMFAATGASTFFKLGLLMMFIPVSGMISKWLNIGDSSSRLGSSLTMVGLGGVVSTMMLASQAGNIIRGGSMTGGNSTTNLSSGEGTSNGSVISNLANSLSNDTGNTSITTSASGQNSQMWNAAKDVVSATGTGIGAAAGLVAGPAGVILGAKVGGAVASGALQFARNVPAAMTNTVASIQKGSAFSNGQSEGFRAMFSRGADANTLLARRETMSNIGESLGSIFGTRAASIGRSLGAGMSGASRERISNAQAAGLNMIDPTTGLPNSLSFQQLATRFPGADARWVQSNEGSSMYVNTSDGWQQVGLSGAADLSLKDGEFRAMDYKLADPNMSYSLQPNGTYRMTAGAETTDQIPEFNNVMAMQTSVSDFMSNNSAVSQMTLGDIAGSSSSVLGSSSPLGASGMNIADMMAVGGSTSAKEIVGNNAVFNETTLGSLHASSHASMGDFVQANSAVANASLSSVVASNPELGSQSVGEFLSNNPALSPQSLGLDFNVNPSLTTQSVSEAMASHSAFGETTLSSIVANNPDLASTSVSDFMTNNPSISNTNLGDVLQHSSALHDIGASDFSANNASFAHTPVNFGNETIGEVMAHSPSVANVSMGELFANSTQTMEQFAQANPSLAHAMVEQANPTQVIGGSSESTAAIPSNQMNYNDSPTVGFKGSSASLMRTSDAYIVGGPQFASSHINGAVVHHISDNKTQRYQDTRFRSEAVNPDSYVFHNPKNVKSSSASDNVANTVHKVGGLRHTWTKKYQQQKAEQRNKNIV